MADLTVTLTESVTLNGVDQGATTSLTVASVVETFKRIVACPTGVDTTVATFKSTSATADGALDVEDVRYVRITNLDSTNSINLNFQLDAGEDDSAADESASFQLLAGQSFIMGDADDCMSVDDDAATPDLTMHPLESIIVDSGANAVQVEVLIATV